MHKLIFCSLLIITITANAQTGAVKFSNPSTLALPRGYSHVVQIDLGTSTMVIISGQVALNAQGQLVGANNMTQQAEQVFTNIKNAMISVGGSMDNIVKLGFFITDITQIQAVRDVKDKFINTKTPPVSTAVEVSKLVREGMMVEVEVMAVVPKK